MSEIDFPVVGIGASAGGLKALQNFFENIPADSGAAFVVITHLAPEKTSAMDELLASHSAMEVKQVKDSIEIQPNHIYVIPPDRQLFIQGKELETTERDRNTHTQVVVDVFFRSLAKACEKSAIGIILSGTGSDGTLGLKAIKEMGGITMVQDPKEAEYDGMPRSAISSGHVDFVMPVEELAQNVVDHKDVLNDVRIPIDENDFSENETAALNEIFGLIISKTGHDFNHYKRASVLRRFQRRMYVTRNKNIDDYRGYLKEHPDEINELFKDLLISVTNFFRDPEAFETLEKEVIPKIFERKSAEDPIRVWVTGCATGEEVYSIAILLHEYASKLNYLPQIKIFGTDISEEALRIARRGSYPETISTDVSKERLERYFHKEDSGYRVSSEIREKVLISKHDLLTDPPFLKQDFISCRNLLIYFNSDLQTEVLKILHYALRTEGFLFLGISDSTIGASEFFSPVNKHNGVYRSRQVPKSRKDIPHFPLLQNMHRVETSGKGHVQDQTELTFDKIHYSLLADQFAPPSVIINDNNEVMHSSKGVERFLYYSEGEPTRDLLKMVSSDVQRSLRNIIFRYNQMEKPRSISQKVKVPLEAGLVEVNLTVSPIDKSGFPQGFRQVIFEEIKESGSESDQKMIAASEEAIESEIVEQLESELEQTKEQLQQTIEEYETSNEELMASNEELLSMNEELQTTTEELETSKEELQSVNEELRTVNQELENKIYELQNLNDDLKNLMEATEIGIIFVDRKLKIRRYTSSAKDLFNLIESDMGRPLRHVTHNLQYENLVEDIEQMLVDHEAVKKQVPSKDGRWYIMHIKPYRTTEHDIAGAVLTFVDITELKKIEDEMEEKIEYQKQLQRDLLEVEKKERWRIGQYLHDETAQNLVAAKTLLDSRASLIETLEDPLNEDIADIKQMIIESLQTIRELSHFVLPIKDNDKGVRNAFERLAEQTKNLYKVKCTFESDDVIKKFKDTTSASSLYYIAQEAVRNAINHGKADNISIKLTSNDDDLFLTVTNDGSGYDEETKGEGMGIHIMKYRAELLEGTVQLESQKDKGTVLNCNVPVKNILK